MSCELPASANNLPGQASSYEHLGKDRQQFQFLSPQAYEAPASQQWKTGKIAFQRTSNADGTWWICLEVLGRVIGTMPR